jgi:hypothetical protein
MPLKVELTEYINLALFSTMHIYFLEELQLLLNIKTRIINEHFITIIWFLETCLEQNYKAFIV